MGGGHAHVQVLRELMLRPRPELAVTLVVDRPVAVYSGMVPACVAGELPRHALEIDVRPLARRAGVGVVVAPVLAVRERTLVLDGRPPMTWDTASLNLGSTVRDGERADVREGAIRTRPIVELLDRLDAVLPRLTGRVRVVVVGGGAGGVELAACLEGRLRRQGAVPEVTLVRESSPFRGRPARAVDAALAQRGVRVVEGRRVADVAAHAVRLDDGVTLEADLVVWATGAAPPAALAASDLPLDARGFVRVRPDLRVVGRDDLFAVGDCAAHDAAPWVPRAGVYAVRAGPVLVHNLLERALVRVPGRAGGLPLRPFTPQRDFLSMLNLGDQTAIVAKWGMATRGAWVWRWKDRIDRRFMEMFQLLEPDGAPRGMAPMPDGDMACGGCAAKVDARGLEAALCDLPAAADPSVPLGLAERDDVAVVRHGGVDVVVTVDGFPAFTDDPWLVGRAAALNATSDCLAKGARPRHALAWVVVPDDVDGPRVLAQVMAGVSASLAAEGVLLVGGHSSVGRELLVGLTVLGEPGPRLWRQDGGQPGDALVLTRALGTGVLWRADRMGLARGLDVQAAIVRMLRGNGPAARVAAGFEVHAATDVTGFGLLGHAAGLAAASGLVAELGPAPALPGVEALLQRGLRSTAHVSNVSAPGVSFAPEVTEVQTALLADPQTCGGLLLAVPAAEAAALVEALRAAGEEDACVVGALAAGSGRVRVRG